VNPLVTFVANALATGVGAATGLQTTMRATQNLRPYPLPHQFAAVLDLPFRRQYLDPGAVLGLYGVTAGMVVLDAGCGAGLFTVEVARMVGEHGAVHAVDIQAPMLARAQACIAGAGVTHLVHLHQCGVYDLPLADDSVDLALLVSTLGEIPDKPAALSEVRRVLKPGGRLGVTDEMLFPAYLLARSTRRWVEEAGFRFLAKTGSPLCYHKVFSNEK
jgi:ubiquinone/menaquinone biosynthesis C-methylase UbiE